MPANIVTCAIRWDAWYSNTAGQPAYATASGLSDPAYQFRAPFWGTFVRPSRLQWSATQATMLQEIAAADAGGIDCWAFLRYNTDGSSSTPTMTAGLDLYKTVIPYSGNLKWASMEQTYTLGNVSTYATQVTRLTNEIVSTQAHYQMIDGNRPLIFLLYVEGDVTGRWGGDIANLKTCLDAIRTSVQAAGLGNPYIVTMRSSAPDSTKSQLGAQAASAYISSHGSGFADTYPTLDTRTRDYWTSFLAAAGEIVPICMAGWSPQPRQRRPANWGGITQKPYFGLSRSMLPTTAQLATHAQAAVDYVNANAALCPQRIILWYAWNEFDEGGWLCPTLSDPPTQAQPGGARLAALAPVLL